MTAPTIAAAPVRRIFVVRTSPERAFDVFARQITRWWPRSYTMLKSALADSVVEPHARGRWYQVGDDGSQCDIGHVLAWEPPSRLLLAWQLDAEWKFDFGLVTEVEVIFAAEGEGVTRVVFEHRLIERMGEKAETVRSQIDGRAGWTELLENYRSLADG